MLSPLRRAATNVLRVAARPPIRSLATAPNDAGAAINDTAAAAASAASHVGDTRSSQSRLMALAALQAKEETHQVMLIPPEEDPLLRFLTNMIMRHGERKKAARTVARTLLHLHTMTRARPLEIVREAILTASPAVKIMTQKHGAKIMYKPIALSEKQRAHFGIKWLLDSAKARPEHTLEERLAREMIDILQATSKEDSEVLKKKLEVHGLAMRNRYV